MAQRKFRFSSALTADGWRTDVNVTLGPTGMIAAVEENARDGNGIKGIAIPAIPNVHSHAHQRLMLGLAETAGPGADSFWTWREVMYGFALKLTPEDLEAVAAQLYVEMLKAGFSIVGEFQYLHHQPDGTPYANRAEMSLRCLAAAEQAGIAITLLPTLYACGGFGAAPPTPAQRRFTNDDDSFAMLYDSLRRALRHAGGNDPQAQRHRLGISPHSLRAVTPHLLKRVLHAIEPDSPIHIHVAEQVKEVEDCLQWSKQRPVEYLLDHFDVSNRWCLIHATHMVDAETKRLATTGAVVGLCPTTEANLGDGIFPATKYRQAGGTIAIGSDSHISVSPAEDLRQLEYSQRLRDLTRNALAAGPRRSTGRSLLDAVLKGGAQALGHPVGAIAPGYRADICVLDNEHPSLAGRSGDAALDTWIFSAGNSVVKDMLVAGQHVVKDRHHIREDEIEAAFRAAVRRLT
jgi:formimidoylglutamate deiminase